MNFWLILLYKKNSQYQIEYHLGINYFALFPIECSLMRQVEEQTQEWTKTFKGSRKRPRGHNPISYSSSQLSNNPMAPEQILFLLENLLEKDFSSRCFYCDFTYIKKKNSNNIGQL